MATSKKPNQKSAAVASELVLPEAPVTALSAVAPERLAEVSAHFGIVSEDLGELALLGADSMNRAMFEVTRAGLAFIKANQLLSLGNGGDRKSVSERADSERPAGFTAWMEQHGLAKQRVYEAMKIAKFVTLLPADQLDDVLALGRVKVALLASLPPEVIDAAAEEGNDLMDKADVMTTAELKEEVKRLKGREKNYEAELERAEMKLQRVMSANQRSTTELLDRTVEVREECMAFEADTRLNLDSLRKLYEEVNVEGPNAPEWRIQMEQLWVAAHVIAARACDLLDLMRTTVHDGDMPERILAGHILTPEEAQRWILDYPAIENRHAADVAARQEKRDEAKPRGRGRPAGSKNKEAKGE